MHNAEMHPNTSHQALKGLACRVNECTSQFKQVCHMWIQQSEKHWLMPEASRYLFANKKNTGSCQKLPLRFGTTTSWFSSRSRNEVMGVGGGFNPRNTGTRQKLQGTSLQIRRTLAHVRSSPYDSAQLLVNFHLEVEMKSYMPGAVKGIVGWVWVCGRLGVWMARIEERSNASPEPRSAM